MRYVKVLLLEDDSERRRRFLDICEHYDWELTDTDKAEDCVELLKKNNYDIVFLDHDLGGEQMVSGFNRNTGSEVARKWRELNLQPHTPIVIIHSLNPVGVEYMRDIIPNSYPVKGIWLLKNQYGREEQTNRRILDRMDFKVKERIERLENNGNNAAEHRQA